MRKRDVRLGAVVTYREKTYTIDGYRDGLVFFPNGEGGVQVEDVSLVGISGELLEDACAFTPTKDGFTHEEEGLKIYMRYEKGTWRIEASGQNATFKGYIDTFEELFLVARLCKL